MDDVRAAAERIRQARRDSDDHDGGYPDTNAGRLQSALDHATLADAWLAANPADDGEAVTGWQPIETAPKDGTWVILFTPAGVQCGYWGGSYFGRDMAWLQYAHRSDYEEVEGVPTHWMPLPEPPTVG